MKRVRFVFNVLYFREGGSSLSTIRMNPLFWDVNGVAKYGIIVCLKYKYLVNSRITTHK